MLSDYWTQWTNCVLEVDSHGGGYLPLQQSIVEDAGVTHMILTGDHFFVLDTHVGSNGWPPNLIDLDMCETLNLSIKALNIPSLQTLTLPLTANLFGDWIDNT